MLRLKAVCWENLARDWAFRKEGLLDHNSYAQRGDSEENPFGAPQEWVRWVGENEELTSGVRVKGRKEGLVTATRAVLIQPTEYSRWYGKPDSRLLSRSSVISVAMVDDFMQDFCHTTRCLNAYVFTKCAKALRKWKWCL